MVKSKSPTQYNDHIASPFLSDYRYNNTFEHTATLVIHLQTSPPPYSRSWH